MHGLVEPFAEGHIGASVNAAISPRGDLAALLASGNPKQFPCLRRAVIGVLEHRAGTLLVELESSASEPMMLALSTGRRAATYYVGGHGGGRFTWYENGSRPPSDECPIASSA
jgi:hypothetical protein